MNEPFFIMYDPEMEQARIQAHQTEEDRKAREDDPQGVLEHGRENICITRLASVTQDWPNRVANAQNLWERILYLPDADAVREFVRGHNLTKPADQLLAHRFVQCNKLASVLSETMSDIVKESSRLDGIKLDVLKPYAKLVAALDKSSADLYRALFRRPAAFVNAVQVQVGRGQQ